MTNDTWNEDVRMPLGIYVHIPFCVKKCAYCDFLSFPAGDAAVRRYIDALKDEIRSRARVLSEKYEVSTIFFGGGTPSAVDAGLLVGVLEQLADSFSISATAEVTVECNPGTVDWEKLEAYRDAGVNRLSFGLQSSDDAELQRLGRIHTYADFLESYGLARNAGFENINIDLISAIPGQSEKSWALTLSKAAALGPTHISAYSLIIEEGTPFYEKYAKGAPYEGELPDEDTDRRMYAYAKAFLAAQGYERYEISNYARPGFECRHNLSYWERVPYRGFGLGASSLIDGVRFKNTSDFKSYLKGGAAFEEVVRLSGNDILEERMFLGLRKTKGIRLDGKLLEVYGGTVNKLTQEGLLQKEGDWIRLTDFGTDVSNYVFAQFLL